MKAWAIAAEGAQEELRRVSAALEVVRVETGTEAKAHHASHQGGERVGDDVSAQLAAIKALEEKKKALEEEEASLTADLAARKSEGEAAAAEDEKWTGTANELSEAVDTKQAASEEVTKGKNEAIALLATKEKEVVDAEAELSGAAAGREKVETVVVRTGEKVSLLTMAAEESRSMVLLQQARFVLSYMKLAHPVIAAELLPPPTLHLEPETATRMRDVGVCRKAFARQD